MYVLPVIQKDAREQASACVEQVGMGRAETQSTSSDHGRATWRWLGLLGILFWLGVGGCAIRGQGGGGAEEAEEEQNFIVGRYAFKRLEIIDKAIAEERFKDAEETLKEMEENEDLNPHERALMWQSRAQVQAMQKDYPGAAESFAKCLEQNALPVEAKSNVQYNLGQMYMVTEQYGAAIKVFNEFLAGEKEPTPQIHQMLAGAYVQEGRFDEALPHAQALLDSEDPHTESSIQLMLAIRVELKQYDEAVTLLKTLIHRFPKKAYWMQLSAAYAQAGQNDRALATLALAHKQGLLTEQAELMQLIQRYLSEGLPLKGATLLTAELESKRVPRNAKSLELLANAWMAARRVEEALDTMEEAAAAAEGGQTYFRLAQLYTQEERWGEAAEAVSRAIKRGSLKEPGHAYLVLGMAQYQRGQRAAARQAFSKAAGRQATKAPAEQWLGTMQKEEESCPTGKEAACALIPGRGQAKSAGKKPKSAEKNEG